MEQMSTSNNSSSSSTSHLIKTQTNMTVPQNTPVSSPPNEDPIYNEETIRQILESSIMDSSRLSLIDEFDMLDFTGGFEECEISANSTTIYESDLSDQATGLLRRTSTTKLEKMVNNLDMDVDNASKNGNERCKAMIGELDRDEDADSDSMGDEILSLRCEKCGADLLNSACAITNENGESMCFSCLCSI